MICSAFAFPAQQDPRESHCAIACTCTRAISTDSNIRRCCLSALRDDEKDGGHEKHKDHTRTEQYALCRNSLTTANVRMACNLLLDLSFLEPVPERGPVHMCRYAEVDD